MLAKCLSYIVFVSCWGCYKCSMYYNYMHLGHFSLLFLMLSCTENWASVSEWRQSQLLSLKPLFKVCKSQQIFKNLSISLKIYFKIIMPVETKCEAWMKLDGWGKPHAHACVPFPTLQRLLSNAPSPLACPCLQRPCYSFHSILFNLQFKCTSTRKPVSICPQIGHL